VSIRHDLVHSIFKLFRHRENSYATHADRRKMLSHFAATLVSRGYGLRNISGLKQKHVVAVVKHWKEKNLAVSTIKNRLAAVRKMCSRLGKPVLVPSNIDLGIGKRCYVPKRNRAIYNPDFSGITNQHIRISLELQRVFGLRREESMKIKPHLADKGNRIELLPTWCKGGRSRIVPVRTEEQRFWLEQAKELAGRFGNSLIPEKSSYIRHRNVYEKQVLRAGLRNLHGLRHAYAQQRYKQLTGWDSPLCGGPCSHDLTAIQKKLDYEVRMILSEELGHSREQITVNYLGR